MRGVDKLSRQEREAYWGQMPTERLKKERDDTARRLRNVETWGEQDQVREDREVIVDELQRRPLEASEVLPEEDLDRLRRIAQMAPRMRNEYMQGFLESRLPALLANAIRGAQMDLDLGRSAKGEVVEIEAEVDGTVRKFRISERAAKGVEAQREGLARWAKITTEQLLEERESALRHIRQAETEGERRERREAYWVIEEEVQRRPLGGHEALEGSLLAALSLIVEVPIGQRSKQQSDLLNGSLSALLANAERGSRLAKSLEKATWGQAVETVLRVDGTLHYCQLEALPLEVGAVGFEDSEREKENADWTHEGSGLDK